MKSASGDPDPPAGPLPVEPFGEERCAADEQQPAAIAALSNRVLELTPEGIHNYGGGYTEYVARTGQEAPGLRS